jgi:VWFA-related protein
VRFVASNKISVEQDWTSDSSLLSKTADRYYAEGGATAVIDASYLAANKMLDRARQFPSRRYALVLISDCEDLNSYYKLSDLFAKADGTDVQIFVIALTGHLNNETGSAMLYDTAREAAIKRAQRIAVKTGGIAFFPEADEQKHYTLSPAAEAIMSELRSQYVIRYVPAYRKTDDKKRTLSVEAANDAKGGKRTVSARDGFFFR